MEWLVAQQHARLEPERRIARARDLAARARVVRFVGEPIGERLAEHLPQMPAQLDGGLFDVASSAPFGSAQRIAARR
jgi:hypothetical protein